LEYESFSSLNDQINWAPGLKNNEYNR